MTLVLGDLKVLKTVVIFGLGFILATVLCCPQKTNNDRCIKFDNVIYCEVEQ